jgi:hypothetical protein
MLSSLLLLVAPLLLVTPAVAAPRLIKLGPGDDAQLECVAVTVTVTTTVLDPPYPSAPTASPQTSPALQATLSIAGQQQLASQNASPNTVFSAPPTPAPAAQSSAATVAPPVVHPAPISSSSTVAAVQASSAASSTPSPVPVANDTLGGQPPSSYRNALYFTNW